MSENRLIFFANSKKTKKHGEISVADDVCDDALRRLTKVEPFGLSLVSAKD